MIQDVAHRFRFELLPIVNTRYAKFLRTVAALLIVSLQPSGFGADSTDPLSANDGAQAAARDATPVPHLEGNSPASTPGIKPSDPVNRERNNTAVDTKQMSKDRPPDREEKLDERATRRDWRGLLTWLWWTVPIAVGAIGFLFIGAVFFYILKLRRRIRFLRQDKELFQNFGKDRTIWQIVMQRDGGSLHAVPKELAQTLGYSPAELERVPFLDLVAPESQTEAQAALAAVTARGRLPIDARLTCRLRTKTGRTFPVEGIIRARRGASGKEAVVLLQEVPWRDELLAVRSQLEALVTSREEGMLFIDEDEVVVVANEGLARIFKLSTAPGDLRGVPLTKIGGDNAPSPGVSHILAEVLRNPRRFEFNGAALLPEVVPIAHGDRALGHLLIFRDAPKTPDVTPKPNGDVVPPTPGPARPAVFSDNPAKELWCPEAMQAHLPWFGEFAYLDGYSVAEAASLPGWGLAGATRRGRLHAHHHTHREDAFRWDTGDHFTIACVSDGAGSSRYSRIGSESTCREVIRSLREEFQQLRSQLAAADTTTLTNLIAGAMGKSVWQSSVFLHDLADKAACDIKDFRCTFLLVVHYETPGSSIMLGSQVGDGFIQALMSDGRTRRFGTADSGEFSGQVSCFLPEDDAVKKAGVIFRIPHEDIEAIALCSDGIEDAFFPIEKRASSIFRQLYLGTGEKLSGFDDQKAHPPVLGPEPDTAALETWLGFEKRGENDDRTLLALYRHPRRLDPHSILEETAL